MKLIYNGVDITSRVFINRCEHETFAEKRADRLLIRFVDSGNRWNAWQPKSGDTITDSVLFIKVSPEGTYIEATEDEAAGVAFEGTAYNLPGHSEIVDADTVILAPITLGEYIKEQNEKWERMQAGVDYLAMMSGVDFDAEQSERKEEVAE